MVPLIAQYLRKLLDLERLFGQVRATVQSSASLLLLLFGKKIQKQTTSMLYEARKALELVDLFPTRFNHDETTMSIQLGLLCLRANIMNSVLRQRLLLLMKQLYAIDSNRGLSTVLAHSRIKLNISFPTPTI